MAWSMIIMMMRARDDAPNFVADEQREAAIEFVNANTTHLPLFISMRVCVCVFKCRI